MSQISFSDAEYAGKRKKTRREVFLAEMEQVVPWKALLGLVEQPVVDSPAVDADGVQRVALSGDAQPLERTRKQRRDIPRQAAPHARRDVGESMRFLETDPASADDTGDNAPSGRTDVDRGERRRHRRNAAATPESTGMCMPAAGDSSPAVRTTTAAATCSGSTSRLSSVRLA